LLIGLGVILTTTRESASSSDHTNERNGSQRNQFQVK